MSGPPEFVASDINRFTRTAQTAIALAWLLDWKVRWLPNHRSAQLIGPNSKFINIPTSNVKDSRARSWLHQIMRSATPDQVADLALGKQDISHLPPEIQRVAAISGAYLVSEAGKASSTEREEPVDSGLTQKIGDAVPVPPKPEPAPEPPKADAPVPVARVTMTERSRKPYIMQSGYPSKHIEVVEYTNGVIMHGCKYCDYVRPKPGSIRSHYVMAHPQGPGRRGGRKSKQETVVVTEPSQPVAKSTTALVGMDLLVHRIREAGLLGNHDAIRTAKHLLDCDFEERARMAMLILNGHDFETLRTSAEEAIEDCKREAAEARAERDTVTGELQSLKDLINQIGGDR